MTVKELKEILECIIEDGKEDYTVYVNELSDSDVIYICNDNKVVYL